ncbi:MAG: o-succinylbenzoate synthase [Ardenticatenaceae bacterium]|nr:o-succinylbenzoate synthase [Ardenticatenaceae bacterium]
MTAIKIDRIELRLICMQLKTPFRTSFGLAHDRYCIIVSAHGEGLTGWGECVASQGMPTGDVADWAFYSYETVETAWHILKDFLAPALAGRSVASAGEVATLGERLRGHPLARAGLEGAVWDLLAQARGLSLADLLADDRGYAQPRRDRVSVGVSIGIMPSVEATVQTVAEYVDQGYRRIKLKIEPGWDVEVARAVRREFPAIPLMLDANSAYTLADADDLRQLDEFNLLMIEQPLAYDDIYEHSRLQAQLTTPICLDESIHSPRQAEWAYEIDACRIINIKPGRVGGLWAGRAIHDLSLVREKPVWCGGMLETGIGRAANIAIASLPGFTLPGDISASDRYYRQDIASPPFVLNPDSTLSVPTGPGLGVTVDLEYLEVVTQRHAVVSRKE